jgi:putative PIN family toxin of toxin-antitoxin system
MSEAQRVVFDCNIFAQALITPTGRAARCLEHVLAGDLQLFWSQYILDEVRNLRNKPTPLRLGLTIDKIERLIDRLNPVVQLVSDPPPIYNHPLDPKDSHYINLAIACMANLVVSRDKHLLKLMDPFWPFAEEFRLRFPDLLVLRPEELLQRLENSQHG